MVGFYVFVINFSFQYGVHPPYQIVNFLGFGGVFRYSPSEAAYEIKIS